MSAAKHTPGPWEIHGDDDLTTVEIRDSRGLAIAEVGDCSTEDQANARLIAAAPRTAQMAMDFTLLVERFFRGGDGCDMRAPATESEVAEAMYALRAHIAKATGSAA